MHKYIPAYIRTRKKGRLKEKIKQASALLGPCRLCPRQCGADRTRDEKGFCSTGNKAVVASFAPHFGEEPQLVGNGGSGALFFSHCNLKCIFCQNQDISIDGSGEPADDHQVASIMLYLQNLGCHNINLVTPTHVVPQILKALDIAAGAGLNIPLVYNCSGYECLETLEILQDVVDIYMPDFKFMDPLTAGRYCHAADYPGFAGKAVVEMHRQVGDLVLDSSGIACSGLLVRHLVMPGGLEDTRRILTFLKENVSPFVRVNIMSQYRPVGKAFDVPAIARPLAPSEFRQARRMAQDLGLEIIR